MVLLTFHYPPDRAVGALRPSKVVRALREQGHTVTVITARLPGEDTVRRIAEDGLEVITVKLRRNPREWYAALKSKWKRSNQSQAEPGAVPVAEASYVIPKRVPYWKRSIFALMLLPDHRQGFIQPAIKAARPYLRRADSVLYTTAPPFSVHLAGLWLARGRRVRWVAEFRDPWTDNPWKPWHVRTAWSDAAERWLERRVLRGASLVVAVSNGIHRYFQRKMAPATDRLLVIQNGIDVLLPLSVGRSAQGGFRVVHIGSFYHGRDPTEFLHALAGASHGARRGLEVKLVGNCRWFGGRSVEELVKSLGLAGVVTFHDWVSHDKAQDLIRSADLLLLLAQNQPDQIPNKLYEYLGTRRPILGVVDDGGDTAHMLRQAGGHFVVPNDRQAIATALGRAMVGEFEATPDAESRLKEWTTAVQMDRLMVRMASLSR